MMKYNFPLCCDLKGISNPRVQYNSEEQHYSVDFKKDNNEWTKPHIFTIGTTGNRADKLMYNLFRTISLEER